MKSETHFDWGLAGASVVTVMVAGLATFSSMGKGGDTNVITPYEEYYKNGSVSPKSDNLSDLGSPLDYDSFEDDKDEEYSPLGGTGDPE